MKLSVSYAFAQSARLATLEAAVDDLIDDVSPIPEALAATGRCTALSPKNVGKLDGRAFFLSSALNLYSDILDVPDFFWEKEDYQPVYERTASYLDVPKRVDILNARLDVVQRLLENLNSRLDVSKSTRLEWVIIVLIVLEVVHIYDPVIRSAGLLSSKFLQKMLLR
ncbi:hypothetical protein M885DRAFT_434503 [Pelagophyceae sp. CCMP2097]|nr:hypothetical protein M885DRAFT_434503 [Pelagophyceae sp. CCMP2097]